MIFVSNDSRQRERILRSDLEAPLGHEMVQTGVAPSASLAAVSWLRHLTPAFGGGLGVGKYVPRDFVSMDPGECNKAWPH